MNKIIIENTSKDKLTSVKLHLVKVTKRYHFCASEVSVLFIIMERFYKIDFFVVMKPTKYGKQYSDFGVKTVVCCSVCSIYFQTPDSQDR